MLEAANTAPPRVSPFGGFTLVISSQEKHPITQKERRGSMKKHILALALSIVFLTGLGFNATAQMSSEGAFSGTLIYAGTFRTIPIDKERFVLTYENTGVRVEDSKSGPFHQVATHNIGVMYFEKGVGVLRGYLTWVDKDGDKVTWECTETDSKFGPVATKGTAKAIAGTGKFTGIQGSMEYTRQNLRPVADMTTQAISFSKGTWKLAGSK
jgi:type 1 fimbria pilin